MCNVSLVADLSARDLTYVVQRKRSGDKLCGARGGVREKHVQESCGDLHDHSMPSRELKAEDKVTLVICRAQSERYCERCLPFKDRNTRVHACGHDKYSFARSRVRQLIWHASALQWRMQSQKTFAKA
jgi:hypothetical protein